jgi:stearoyl-CoA desaturase (delta-9 desaturase)
MLNYTSIGLISFFHAVAMYGFFTLPITNIDIITTLFMYFFTGLGITAGYHRLWSHRTYKASIPVQFILAFAGAGASEGSILWWSKYHRLHHNMSDTEDDPYGPQKGFFYSHIWWIFENKDLPKLKDVNVKDLKSNPIVMFQHKYYLQISLLCSIGLPFLYYYYYNLNLFHCFIYPIAIARVILWHSTWFVNSLAHWLGDQPHGKSGTSRDHMFTAFLTFGEGYHNYHHEYPYDYRNGLRWYDYDPTKWLIETLYILGLVFDLKTRETLNNKINKKVFEKEMTLEEYKNSDKNLILYNSSIYDVSDLIYNHPGGAINILMVLRKEEEYIKEMMSKFNNHTQNAYKLLEKCKICNLKKN